MSGGASPQAGGEDGFALVAALMAALLFALFAYAVIASDRGAVAGLNARLDRVRMEAAADAAVATIASDLSGGGHWPLDGRPQSLDLQDMEITAAVQDDRGLIPANGLKSEQIQRLIQSAGVSERNLDTLVQNIQDWQDGGQRPKAATPLDYAAEGLRQRGNAIRTVDELAEVKGVTPDMLTRIAPDLTVFPDVTAAFDPKLASPRAKAVMAAGDSLASGSSAPGSSASGSSASGSSASGSRTFGSSTFSLNAPATPVEAGGPNVGRPFTVTLDVADAHGGRLHRVVIIELTGMPNQPVWIRAFT